MLVYAYVQEALDARVQRAVKQVAQGRYNEAVAEAMAVAAVTIYNVACAYALAIVPARQDSALFPTEREERAEQFATAAVTLLRLVIAQDCEDTQPFANDHDLDALRERQDFRLLIQKKVEP